MPLPEFRKSHVGNPDLYAPMTQLVETISATTDSGDNADVFYEVLATVARLADGAADRSDLERLSDMLKELRTAIDIFAKHADKRKVSIFGSARTKPEEPQYQLAYDVAAAMVEHDWMIMTGGGPGIMTAGMEGGGRENSFGLSIVLPFETEPPEILARDPKLIDFKYFFTRKLHLVKE
ncbi:MAG: LOG family protein, partial [Acidimicrobiales bacterium]